MGMLFDIQSLVNIVATGTLFPYSLVAACIIILRWVQPFSTVCPREKETQIQVQNSWTRLTGFKTCPSELRLLSNDIIQSYVTDKLLM